MLIRILHKGVNMFSPNVIFLSYFTFVTGMCSCYVFIWGNVVEPMTVFYAVFDILLYQPANIKKYG